MVIIALMWNIATKVELFRISPFDAVADIWKIEGELLTFDSFHIL